MSLIIVFSSRDKFVSVYEYDNIVH